MTIGAGLGIADFPFASAAEFWSWIELCDRSGVDSIWQSDRIISPTPNLEAMSTMAALAGGSRRLKFGMNVASLALRDPVITAKACATIDVLSAGRLLPAFGLGSARGDDFKAMARPTAGRGKRMNEALEIITRLWREDHVDYDGEFYSLCDASIAPKPVQSRFPLWIGGSSAQAIERTARWGTGWQAGIETPEGVAPVIAAIKARSAELERPIDEDHYGAGFGFRFGDPNAPIMTHYNEVLAKRLGKIPKGVIVGGGVDEMMDLLIDFHGAGVHKFILRPIATNGMDFIHQTERFINELMPEINRLNRRDT